MTFAESPFLGACRREPLDCTPASYIIEGGSSRDYVRTKQMMVGDGQTWHTLMGKLACGVADYLAAQAQAGAPVVQLFDRWVGCLSPADYREYVLPPSQLVLRAARAAGVPAIHFGTDTATLLPLMKEAGGDVIGLDWRAPLDRGWDRLGPEVGIRGNLDPAALFAPRPELVRRARAILAQAAGRPGHSFNLGHGVLPDTPVQNVKAVAEMVHEFSTREAA